MPTLIVTEQEKEGGQEKFDLPQEILIGRGPEAPICLDSEQVSRSHARIITENNQYYLIDLESSNGTFLNGNIIQPNEYHLLRHQDNIVIGQYHIRFSDSDFYLESGNEDEEDETTDPDILDIKLLKKVLDAIDQENIPSIEVLNGIAEGKKIFLTDDSETIIIGRDPGCDLTINEKVISREHASITKKWGGAILKDFQSKNGTYINNRRISEEELRDGDRIALGTIVLLYRNPKEVNLKEIEDELAQKQSEKLLKQEKIREKEEAKSASQSNEEETEVSDEEPASKVKQKEANQPPRTHYPPPKPKKELTLLEWSFVGLGVIVFSFGLITIINLLLS